MTAYHIRAGRFLLAIFTVAAAFATIVRFAVLDSPLSPAAIGETLGHATGLTLFAALVIVPWRAIQRRTGRFSNMPLSAGSLFAIVVAALWLVGVTADSPSRFDGHRWPQNAEYSVVFPSAPTERSVSFEGIAGQQAELTIGNSVLRAEWTPIDAELARNYGRYQLEQSLRLYALHNGLEYTETYTEQGILGLCAYLRGTKIIRGVPATFRNIACVGHSSLFVLYTGAPSNQFPMPEISDFVNSVRWRE